MNPNYCVFLDAGHGGLDNKKNYVSAPGKQFMHTQGVFHNGPWFYEGVFNRTIVYLVYRKLKKLGIDVQVISHEYLDLSLQYRVDTANWYHSNYKPGILVSSHANASLDHKARGFEIYTTPGNTRADQLAEQVWNQVEALLGKRIRMRSNTSDGDPDKEANFFILRKTRMPAVLIEHLFFDNYQDALLLLNDEVVELFAEAQVRSIIAYLNLL